MTQIDGFRMLTIELTYCLIGGYILFALELLKLLVSANELASQILYTG